MSYFLLEYWPIHYHISLASLSDMPWRFPITSYSMQRPAHHTLIHNLKQISTDTRIEASTLTNQSSISLSLLSQKKTPVLFPPYKEINSATYRSQATITKATYIHVYIQLSSKLQIPKARLGSYNPGSRSLSKKISNHFLKNSCLQNYPFQVPFFPPQIFTLSQTQALHAFSNENIEPIFSKLHVYKIPFPAPLKTKSSKPPSFFFPFPFPSLPFFILFLSLVFSSLSVFFARRKKKKK